MRTEAEAIKARIIRTHEELATMYRQIADEACSNHDPFQVYFYVKASMAEEQKARRIRREIGQEG